MRFVKWTALFFIVGVVVAGCAALGIRMPPWEDDPTHVSAFEDYESWHLVTEEPVTGDPTGLLNGLFAAHGGEQAFRFVYVNPVGEAVSSGDAPLPYPEGTMIVKTTFGSDNGEPGDLSDVMVMVKRESDYDPDNANWEYINLNRNLRIRRQGAIRACYDCHSVAEAADYVFTDNR